jgi:hypothetical protein
MNKPKLTIKNELNVWKKIDGYPNYSVSGYGSVRNDKSGQILTCSMGDRYYHVNLLNEGHKKCFSIHRLIALAFIPNPNNYETVDHINRIKTDNRISNLQWANRFTQTANRGKFKGSTSKYFGVCKQHAKWRSQLTYKGKRIDLGSFNTEIGAAIAYNQYVIDHKLERILNVFD